MLEPDPLPSEPKVECNHILISRCAMLIISLRGRGGGLDHVRSKNAERRFDYTIYSVENQKRKHEIMIVVICCEND